MNYFLAGFFGLAFGVAFGFEALADAFGRPRVPASFIVIKSASLYKPVEPIYLNGLMPAVLSRLLIAADEALNRWAISSIVIPSIDNSLSPFSIINQAIKVKKLLQNRIYFDKISKNVNIIGNISKLLYNRIVKTQKKYEFLKIFCQTLDNPTRRVYIIVKW